MNVMDDYDGDLRIGDDESDDDFEYESLSDEGGGSDSDSGAEAPTLEEAYQDKWFCSLYNNFLDAARRGLKGTPFVIPRKAGEELQIWLLDHVYCPQQGFADREDWDKAHQAQLLPVPEEKASK